MEIVKTFVRNDSYIELTTDKEKIVIPSDKAIFVDDTSGFVSLKGVATRKTLYLIPDDVYNGGGGDDPSGDTHDYSTDYLTIESLEDNNTIGWKLTDNTAVAKNISYSTDGGETWATTRATAEGTTIATLNSGDKLLLKGNETAYGLLDKYTYFTSTGQFNVEGNIMSLLYEDGFSGETELTERYTFSNLFSGCTGLVSAENLILPATTLANSCYYGMFYNCRSLTAAPELPATTLVSSCYRCMFQLCTSLTTAPSILPATTLADMCYYDMFSRCESLTTAPALPATTLAYMCYYDMFVYCTSLTTAPALPATTLAEYCYFHMFLGCTSLTTAPELPATALARSCYLSMFAYCTSLTTAPELPATALARSCYLSMFDGCTNLNYIKMLATDISASGCLDYWVKNVASTGTFVKNAAMDTLPTGNSGIPNGWTVQDA